MECKYEKCYFCDKKSLYNDVVVGEVISVCRDHFNFSSFTS